MIKWLLKRLKLAPVKPRSQRAQIDLTSRVADLFLYHKARGSDSVTAAKDIIRFVDGVDQADELIFTPTRSSGLYHQQFGRGNRIIPASPVKILPPNFPANLAKLVDGEEFSE